MTLQRGALAALAVLALLSVYTLAVAAGRFGDATNTFDGVELELISFDYARGADTVDLAVRVSNPGRNAARIIYFEYAFVINGVLAGGGDIRPGGVIEPGESQEFQLQGRISDRNYVERQDPERPLAWLVNARVQVSVDERLEPVFIPFSFRTETP